eukprot:gene48380-1654_t
MRAGYSQPLQIDIECVDSSLNPDTSFAQGKWVGKVNVGYGSMKEGAGTWGCLRPCGRADGPIFPGTPKTGAEMGMVARAMAQSQGSAL